MTTFKFSTPAKIKDFSENSAEQEQLNENWSLALIAYTRAARVSNPWTVDYQAPCDWYVDPTEVEIGQWTAEPVFWTAFPNRLKIYFSKGEKSPYQFDPMQVYALGDFGNIPQSEEFSTGLPFLIPSIRCPYINWNQPVKGYAHFDPNGPRGWLDEYCEWAVTRNEDGKITKISFTCENPEYWYSLWQVSPEKVLELYQQLVSPSVTLHDLYLPSKDDSGYVIDPVTKREAYNPLNKWNSGTVATATKGGAVHLTSPPNTIGAEIMLAAQATLLRALSPADYNMQNMVCTGAYGRPYRNSDPHIGFQVNQLVKKLGVMVTLTDPVGLYLQAPDFSSYHTPDNTDASQFYTVVRGTTAVENGMGYDQILHAEFSVPENYGYTVSDIQIGNEVLGASQKPQPILYAGQIAETFHVCLAGTAVKASTHSQNRFPPVEDKSGNINGQPSMLISNAVLNGMLAVNAFPPFVQLPVPVSQAQSIDDMALQVSYSNSNFKDAEISFWNADGSLASGIEVTVNEITSSNGTPAGLSSGGGDLYNYILSIYIAPDVSPGLKGVTAHNPDCDIPLPLPGVLNVIEQGAK